MSNHHPLRPSQLIRYTPLVSASYNKSTYKMLISVAPGVTIDFEYSCTVEAFVVRGVNEFNSAGQSLLGFGPDKDRGLEVILIAYNETNTSACVLDALEIKYWQDCSQDGCTLLGNTWDGDREIQVVFASPDAKEEFDRYWTLSVLRFYSKTESEEQLTRRFLVDEDTGERLTLLEIVSLLEYACADDDDMQEEQTDAAAV